MTDDDIQTILSKLAGNDASAKRRAYEKISQSKDIRFVDGLID